MYGITFTTLHVLRVKCSCKLKGIVIIVPLHVHVLGIHSYRLPHYLAWSIQPNIPTPLPWTPV